MNNHHNPATETILHSTLALSEMKKIKILNIDITSISLNELLSSFDEGVLITTNVDHLVNLQKDKEFYNVYNKAEWVVCDSRIINLTAKFLNRRFKETIPGASFFPAFYNYHRNNRNMRIFLLGSAKGVAVKAMENINTKVGWNIIVGAHSPSFGFENNIEECNEIAGIINKSGANVLVVGVGAPKQEKWIMQYKYLFVNIKILMALGATIDYESGKIKRAPVLLQKMNLEWLYRLINEPKRLWKRYLIEDIFFFWYILKEKLGFYKNPFSK